MSIERVRAYFKELGREGDILEFPVSSATVELAAQAVGVIPARIAKTLSFLVDGKCVLIVAAGDAKVDNSKYKAGRGDDRPRRGRRVSLRQPGRSGDLPGRVSPAL